MFSYANFFSPLLLRQIVISLELKNKFYEGTIAVGRCGLSQCRLPRLVVLQIGFQSRLGHCFYICQSGGYCLQERATKCIRLNGISPPPQFCKVASSFLCTHWVCKCSWCPCSIPLAILKRRLICVIYYSSIWMRDLCICWWVVHSYSSTALVEWNVDSSPICAKGLRCVCFHLRKGMNLFAWSNKWHRHRISIISR